MKNNFLKSFGRALMPSPVNKQKRWLPVINDPYPGAWQKNDECETEDMLGYHAVYACITLIAGDISKLPLKLVRKDDNGIWIDYENPAYSPVIRKPNRYQNRIDFYENWVLSLLINGNTYVLKQRDNRGVVTQLYILDPNSVIPRITTSGEIWYQLSPDDLSQISESTMVPASEIIHHRINPIYHPLIGVSPLYAAARPVLQGIKIQENSSHFFSNYSRPGGILTAPGALEDETVMQMKAQWETNYTGNNSGKVAVLADGLKYESFQTQTASDSQVIEQLGWTASVVCSVFHVPLYMIDSKATPNLSNVEALNQQYYSQALQKIIEKIELCLDEGLGMDHRIGTEFDIDNLLRMDTQALISSEKEATSAGIKKINESRKRLNLPPIEGGDTAYLQQQNYSLAALSRRDAREDPFSNNNQNANQITDQSEDDEDDQDLEQRFMIEFRRKSLERFAHV